MLLGTGTYAVAYRKCMRNKLLLFVGVLGLTILLASSPFTFGQSSSIATDTWALVGGTIYVSPSEAPILNGVVIIKDSKIVTVGRKSSVTLPRGLKVLDCTRLTITAGFWNSHVHFIQRKWADVSNIPAPELTSQLQDMLTRYGFTRVFDTGSKWENTRRLRERIESGEVAGPRIHSTGEIIFPKGGGPEQRILDVVGTMRLELPEVSNATEASAAAKKLLDEGVDGIKVYAASLGWPTVLLTEAEIAAAAHEAHLRGKLVFAHPQTREGLLNAVHGRADIIVHSIPNAGVLDDSMLTPMKKAGVSVIPTLKLWRHELRNDRTSQREQFVSSGVAQLRTWLASDGVVLFGTDVGYMDDDDTSEEFALMGEAGMSFRQILASLTTAPAERFGESVGLGRIAPGLIADMVILDKDPSKDVRAFAAVRYTIRDGRVIYEAKATRSPHLRP
jgi:imidazolonepropionase-like amidohydrolase